MKKNLITLAIAACCLSATMASAMERDAYKTEKNRIAAEYKAAKTQCGTLKSNAKDICQSEAKGVNKVAMAQLDATDKPSPKADEKVRVARADAAYDTAREKCDDLAANAKDVCRKDAKAVHVQALGVAKVSKANADGGTKTNEARADANSNNKDAQYAAAKERCDAMNGAPKDTCIADAKKKFGKL